jgi:hypothetical protein
MSEYRLDELGWFQFERLCQSLLKARLGLSVEAWGGSGDLGRDAYAKGPLRFPGDEENDGPFVFQAKFVAGANAAGAKPMPALLKGVRAELKRIGEREEAGRWEEPRFYTLLTNTPLTAKTRKEVEKVLESGPREWTVTVLGAADIDSMLDNSDRVRLAFPQILGLRDIFDLLEQTVHKDIITRSKVALRIGAELATTFVATGAYEEALRVLERRHFVVLTGPPEMGKTTIARIISLAKLSEGWEAYECRGPNDLIRIHEPETAQVFVADDAFGSTEYQPDKGNEWAEDLEHVLALLDSRHWLLLTSRPAPLRTALEKLYLQGEEEEKAQMLYRHAKSSVKSKEGRALIVKHAEAMVGHKDFTPLRIKHFVTKGLAEVVEQPEKERQAFMGEAVAASMAEPTKSMTTSFAGLPEDCKALLISMLDSHESLIALADLAPAFERHLGRAPNRPTKAAAEIVDEHFLRLVHWDDFDDPEPSHVEWVHPSVRDMVIGHLMADAAARRAFLSNAGIDGVMLALSSGGGAEGKRQFPLLEGAPEWAEIERRVLELPADESADALQRLLALLSDTARLSRSVDKEAVAARLAELSRHGLEALREQWEIEGATISNADLRNFYRASALLAPPVKGPDLGKTWADTVEMTKGSIGGDVEEMMLAAEEWMGLAELLEHHDPEQMESFSFPAEHGELLEGIVEQLEGEEAALDHPLVSNVDDPSEYEEAPPDLNWLNGLEDVLGAVSASVPALSARCEAVISKLFDKAGEWEEYGERHSAYNEPEPEHDDEGFGSRSGGSDGSFSVASVFTDL